MRHLWVIEEKAAGKSWRMMADFYSLEVYITKREATPNLLEFRCCMPDDYEYRIVKYVPEGVNGLKEKK